MKSLATSWLFLALCVASGFAELNVTQTAEPGQVLDGLTQSLTINCSIWDDFNSTESNSTVTQALSMVIFLKPTGGNGSIEIATISSIKDPDSPTVTPDGLSLKATATGHLETFGDDSYLTVHIDYPFKNATGDYSCKLVGMDDSYHVHEIEESDLVNFTSPGMQSIVNEIQNHDVRLVRLEMDYATLTNRLTQFVDTMFTNTTSVNGSRYRLSRPVPKNFHLADSICKLDGGKLLEIDSQEEYDTVKSILESLDVQYQVMMGITDAAKEGVWRFMERPDLTSTVLPWCQEEPSDSAGEENCASIVPWPACRWQFNDAPCAQSSDVYTYVFICEDL